MGFKIVNNKKADILAFLLLLSVFVVSYFEYFFRDISLRFWIVVFVLLIPFFPRLGKVLKAKYLISICAYIVGTFCVCLLQTLTNSSIGITYAMGQVFLLFIFLLLAIITKESLCEKMVALITIIAAYSVIIYALCSFFPQIKYYLIDVLTPHFTSLGAENAIQEGAGKNFIVYNFQQLSEYTLIFRNCGPFWEPGMFAVFLNIALFVNLFLLKGKSIVTIILVIALLTTVSTGGYIGGLFILICSSILNKKNILFSIASIVLFVVFLIFFFNTDFMGDKLVSQLTDTTLGDDTSRFGALLTHLKIFADHPIWGYYGLEGYVVDDRKALASGLLIPLSSRGFIVGLLYYYLLYKASLRYSAFYARSKRVGVSLFLLILLLSMSQTMLLSSCLMVYIFAGLLLKQKTEYVTV